MHRLNHHHRQRPGSCQQCHSVRSETSLSSGECPVTWVTREGGGSRNPACSLIRSNALAVLSERPPKTSTRLAAYIRKLRWHRVVGVCGFAHKAGPAPPPAPTVAGRPSPRLRVAGRPPPAPCRSRVCRGRRRRISRALACRCGLGRPGAPDDGLMISSAYRCGRCSGGAGVMWAGLMQYQGRSWLGPPWRWRRNRS